MDEEITPEQAEIWQKRVAQRRKELFDDIRYIKHAENFPQLYVDKTASINKIIKDSFKIAED